jgi:hypothetical protein
MPTDPSLEADRVFVLTHLDAQIASVTTMIAAARASGAPIDLLKAREKRLRKFVERLRPTL